jgi:hypothetical protein
LARRAVDAVINDTRNKFRATLAASGNGFRANLTAKLKSYLGALVARPSGSRNTSSQHGQIFTVAPLRTTLERELSRLFC